MHYVVNYGSIAEVDVCRQKVFLEAVCPALTNKGLDQHLQEMGIRAAHIIALMATDIKGPSKTNRQVCIVHAAV